MLTADLTRADRLAELQFAANLQALAARQPWLIGWLEDEPLAWEWLFARDGTLSGRDSSGRWIGGCSVPTRLSKIVLKNLDVRGSVACFLAPHHASDLQMAFSRLTDAQAIIVIAPTHAELATMLHCIDFSAAIHAGRLFMVAGSAWEVQLERLFDEQPGLTTPSNFIRLPATEAAIIEPLIHGAQSIIQATTERRSAQVTRQREAYTPPRQNKLCIVAPLKFRLWNDFEPELRAIQQIGSRLSIQLFDTDDPANAAPHSLVAAACAADVLMTINTARTDLPGLIPTDLPWISWITGTRVPSGSLAGDNDRLLISHAGLQAAALTAGWSAEQIRIADWPTAALQRKAGKRLSLICDTANLDTPGDLTGYSSHLVLWETIRAELLANPFVLRSVDSYLQKHLTELGITDSAFAPVRFIEQLIVPGYAQGLAQTLVRANLPLAVWGKGWDRVDGVSCRGEINSRDDLQNALKQSAALVHPLVARAGHPILRTGLPVIAATDAPTFLRLARQALDGRVVNASPSTPTLTATLLESLFAEIGI